MIVTIAAIVIIAVIIAALLVLFMMGRHVDRDLDDERQLEALRKIRDKERGE